jgi:hypothetical protein
MEDVAKTRKREWIVARATRVKKKVLGLARGIAKQNGDKTASLKTEEEEATLPFDDRQRTRARWVEATKLLQKGIESGGVPGTFDFPELVGEPEEFNDSKFVEKIELAIETRHKADKTTNGWKTCRHIVQCIFSACSPFGKNFLTIAKEIQAVFSGVLRFSQDVDQHSESLWFTHWRLTFVA